MSVSHRVIIAVSDFGTDANSVPCDMIVDWGDGTVDQYLAITSPPSLSHEYVITGFISINVIIKNKCGELHRNLTTTLQDSLTGLELLPETPLTITSIIPNPSVAYNVPDDITVTGTLRVVDITDYANEPIPLQFGLEFRFHSSVELHRFPLKYTTIPPLDFSVSTPDDSTAIIRNINYAYSYGSESDPDYTHTGYASIAATAHTVVAVRYRGLVNSIEKQLFQNIGTVTLFGSLNFLNRIALNSTFQFSNPESVTADNRPDTDQLPVNMADVPFPVFMSTVDFQGEQIGGFSFRINADETLANDMQDKHSQHWNTDAGDAETCNGTDAHWLGMSIQYLNTFGEVVEMPPDMLDVYSLEFLHGLTLINSNVSEYPEGEVLLSAGMHGEIHFSSILPIRKIEITCNSSGITRIPYDTAVALADNKVRLECLFSDAGDLATQCHRVIPIIDGVEVSIYKVEVFTVTPDSPETMPNQVSLTPITTDTYFYETEPEEETYKILTDIKRLTGIPVSYPFTGTCTLDTIYGTININYIVST